MQPWIYCLVLLILYPDVLVANTQSFISDDSIAPGSHLAAEKTLPGFPTNMLPSGIFAQSDGAKWLISDGQQSLSNLLLNNFLSNLLLNDPPNFKHNINNWNSDSNIRNWPDFDFDDNTSDETPYIPVNNTAGIIKNVSFQIIFWVSLNNIQDSDIESVQCVKFFKKFAAAAFELHSDKDIKVLHCSSTKKLDNFTVVFGLWCEKKYIKYQTYDGLCNVLQPIDHPLVKSLPKQLSTLQRHCL